MKSYEQIVKDMQDYIKANMDGDNKVTGFHEGSVLLTLIEAFAGELEFIGIDIENDLKKRLIDYLFSYFNHKKLPGTKATIKVKFWSEEEARSLVTINAGTKVQDESGLVFVTKDTAMIHIGQKETLDVTCVAEDVGSKYNIKEETKLELATAKIGVDGVTLTEHGKGGADVEDDVGYRERFSQKLNGFATSTEPGIVNAIQQEVDTLKRIKLQEQDVENTHFTVYAINHSNSLTEDEKDKIYQIANKNRSCGIRFRVLSPTTKQVEPIHIFIVSYNTIHGACLLRELIKDAIEKKIDALGIGENWSYMDIVDALRDNDNIYSFKINYADSDKDKKLKSVGDEILCKDDEIFIRNTSEDAIVVEFDE